MTSLVGEQTASVSTRSPSNLYLKIPLKGDISLADTPGCYRHIQKIFTELEEFRAFELLRSGRDRSKYLLIKTAKIIAMTCTHAALRRRDLVELNFKYDNVLMEEAAQILEIETFIPLMLQNPEDGYNRLKRVILIGDHHQLPPVIKNMAFQKFSNMEQSLFTRFVRLGVPYVELDAQGRARPSICQLYSWRYDNLGNLDHVVTWPKFKVANPGFFYDYQLINVPDFNGIGESEPNPYFYQNLGEAEYCVALFMYMRLLGYPAATISILTTYNGQKHLIRDVIDKRCGDNPLIGRPHKLMMRPMELVLAPHEQYPSNRPVGVPPEGKPTIINDMPQLAQFVYDMYTDNVRAAELQARAKAEETKVENTVPPTTEKNEIEKPGGEIEVKEQLIVNEVQPEVEGGGT